MPGSSSIPKNGVHSAPAYVVGTATIRRQARLAVLGERRDDRLAGVDRATATEADETVGLDGTDERACLAHCLDRHVRPDAVVPADDSHVSGARSARARGDEHRTLDCRLGADLAERLDRAGAEADDSGRCLGGHVTWGRSRQTHRALRCPLARARRR